MKKKTYKFLKSLNQPAGIILGVNSTTGLSILRSLGNKCIPAIGIDKTGVEIGSFSRYCFSAEVYSAEDELISLLQAIGNISRKKNLLFCANDRYLLIVEKQKKQLEKYFHLFLPKTMSVRQIINKKSMLKLAEDAGLELPKTFFSDEYPLETIIEKIPYPCLVKPLYTQPNVRTKGEVIKNKKDLNKVIRSDRFNKEYLIQEIIEGPEHNFWTCAGYVSKNQIIFFTCFKLRQIPKKFGAATIAVSKKNREIVVLSKIFLTHINYTGFFDIEFKIDIKDGKYKFIEINPRICGLNELIFSSGINLPYIAYSDILLLTGIQQTEQEDGIQWINILDDFITCIKYYQKNNKHIIFDWIKKIKKSDSYADFNSTDIKPFILLIYSKVNHFIKKLVTSQ